MAEPVFRTLEILLKAAITASETRISFLGEENIPERGGAVIATNHTGYVDWLPASYAAVNRRRRLRFLIKADLQQVRSIDFVIRHIKLIPVDRGAGADAYAVAVQRPREGELVGVHPEATISRSFELREFKTGAALMAHEADVPIIPPIVWGAHRIWTKDHPKSLGRKKIPITMNIGKPLYAGDTVEQTQAALRESMTTLLHETQESYPHPAGAYWVPRRLGGGAPTPEEAKMLEEAEFAERARKRAKRDETARKRVELLPRHRRFAKTKHGGNTDQRRRVTPYDTGERSKLIA